MRTDFCPWRRRLFIYEETGIHVFGLSAVKEKREERNTQARMTSRVRYYLLSGSDQLGLHVYRGAEGCFCCRKGLYINIIK